MLILALTSSISEVLTSSCIDIQILLLTTNCINTATPK